MSIPQSLPKGIVQNPQLPFSLAISPLSGVQSWGPPAMEFKNVLIVIGFNDYKIFIVQLMVNNLNVAGL